MRVLGVDPGLTRCGLGVVDGAPGKPLKLVDVTVIHTPASAELGDRLLTIERQVEAWLARYQPETVAIERVFSQHNVRTVMGTAQASGVAALVSARHGIPVVTHTPSEIKASVSGNGRADKAQVTAMVTRLLKLTERPTPADAADALAIAICQVWRGGAMNRLQAASRRLSGMASGASK